MEPIVKSKRAPSSWAKAVSEHMKGGGSFPKKGSADYDAVTKIKERLAKEAVANKEPVASVAKSAVPRAKKAAAAVPAPAQMVPDAREILTKPALDAPKPKAPRKPRVAKEPTASQALKMADTIETKKGPAAAVPLARLGATKGIKLPFSNVTM